MLIARLTRGNSLSIDCDVLVNKWFSLAGFIGDIEMVFDWMVGLCGCLCAIAMRRSVRIVVKGL